MKTKFLSLLIALAIVFLGFAGVGQSATYEYPLWGKSPQQNLIFCGPSVAQAWIYTLTGNWWSQYTLANTFPGVYNGTNSGEMTMMLNWFAGSGRWFYYMDHWSQSSAEHRIVVDLKVYRHRLAIPGNTVNNYGKITGTGSHWLLIYAANISGNTVYWVKVHDPLYQSGYSGYTVIPYSQELSRRDLFRLHWSKLGHGAYQAVGW